jgi:hypothetical protein
MPWLLCPLVVFTALNSYLGAGGLGGVWTSHAGHVAPWPALLAVAAALHVAWILCAVHRRGLVVSAAWPIGVHFSRLGLEAEGFDGVALIYAIIAETILLALATSLAPPLPWAERLARWRRARADIAVQLRMGEGVLPWLREAAARFLRGRPERPAGAGFRRFAADLADAECRLRVNVARLAAPEHLRQSLATSGARLLAEAERAASHLSIGLEQQALAAAAACRDECERLPGVRDADRQALARQCEALLMNLARQAGSEAAPVGRSRAEQAPPLRATSFPTSLPATSATSRAEQAPPLRATSFPTSLPATSATPRAEQAPPLRATGVRSGAPVAHQG